ncbi:hypothetical protein [Kordiimonas aestuarii]|uniref:hypothetical protein n=1 Tax=Kordiimonas aestuarii TaxID=1005925 RepID=UPI0021D2D2E8|nr:hypothetical protein [Kordiimonas aestuarii]
MPSDFGVCIYTPGMTPGTLEASWFEAGMDTACKGLATGGPASGFDGSYNVTYFGADGAPLATFDLTIKHHGEIFALTWQSEGRTACTGVGLPTADGGIALAYRTSD